MDEKRTWKDYFLSSGLPLEHSVIQIFEKLKIYDTSVFQYERKNQDGVLSTFSIDVCGNLSIHHSSRQSLIIDFLCECKYRHDNVKWVFTPNVRDLWYITLSDYWLILDEMTEKYVVNKDRLKRMAQSIPLCDKGIEIYEKETNNKTIEQALSQLRYGVPNKILDSLIYQVDPFPDLPRPIYITVPIIVTTAELWRIDNGVSISDIRKAEKIEQIGKNLESLIIYDPPDNLYKRYSRVLVENGLEKRQKQKIDTLLRNNLNLNYNIFWENKFLEKPSFFFVIKYEYLSKILKRLLTIFKDPLILKEREKPKTAEQLVKELREKAEKSQKPLNQNH
jgi:hypothetical protein